MGLRCLLQNIIIFRLQDWAEPKDEDELVAKTGEGGVKGYGSSGQDTNVLHGMQPARPPQRQLKYRLLS